MKFLYKKVYIVLGLALLLVACSEEVKENETEKSATTEKQEEVAEMKTFHDFKVTAIDGSEFDLASLKGKKVMLVNTASECGLTPQYQQLQDLYAERGGDKFTIIGFPANNFGAQEPGADAEIASFCKANYGVTFPMMSKISVKGDDIHPLYQWLTSKAQNGVADVEMKWNFQKFLIDENGNFIKTVSPEVLPIDEEILSWIGI